MYLKKVLLGSFSQVTLLLVYCPSHAKITSLAHGRKEIAFKWLFFFLINDENAIQTLPPVFWKLDD